MSSSFSLLSLTLGVGVQSPRSTPSDQIRRSSTVPSIISAAVGQIPVTADDAHRFRTCHGRSHLMRDRSSKPIRCSQPSNNQQVAK